MTDLLPPAPCYEDPAPRPTTGSRVVEMVATGTNGGAREHAAALLWGLDRDRFDVRAIVLSEGSSLGRWRETGVRFRVALEQDNERTRQDHLEKPIPATRSPSGAVASVLR